MALLTHTSISQGNIVDIISETLDQVISEVCDNDLELWDSSNSMAVFLKNGLRISSIVDTTLEM